MKKNQRTIRTRRHIRRPFSPPEPVIVAGRFQGKLLSSLSDEELRLFIRVDARRQTVPAFPPLQWPSLLQTLHPQAPCNSPDLSQYWFAKYELERRTPEQKRPVSLELSASDSDETVALKLLEYGFRAASRKFHPDHGGDTTVMQRLNGARDLARNRLRPGRDHSRIR